MNVLTKLDGTFTTSAEWQQPVCFLGTSIEKKMWRKSRRLLVKEAFFAIIALGKCIPV
jgi:hypothetical protein